MSADLLARVRAEIEDRLARLAPARAEYERLLVAEQALDRNPQDDHGSPAQSADSPRARRTTTATLDTVGERAGESAAPAPVAGSSPVAARRTARARPSAKPRHLRTGATEQAIVAALEHGSHTVGELGIVTALPAADIRESLRRMQAAKSIARVTRDGDGRSAYALSRATAR